MAGYDHTGGDHGRPRTGRMADQLFQSPEIGGLAPSCGLCFGLEQENACQLFQKLFSEGSYIGREQSSENQLFQSSERHVKLPDETTVRQSAVSEYRKVNGFGPEQKTADQPVQSSETGWPQAPPCG